MKKIISVVLAVTMICSVFVLPAAANTETDNRVWFDLKGNSRFFVDTNSTEQIYQNRNTYKDYLPGVDFAGHVAAPTGDFLTDQTAVKNPPNGGAMFLYKTGEPSDTHNRWSTTVFTEEADGSTYWTINGVSYLIKTNEKVLKTCKNTIDTSALTDADMIARYKSVNEEAVIDVEDGSYKSVGFLAGIASGQTRDATVTLVYSDEEVENSITVNPPSMTDAQKYSNGNIYLKNFTNSNDNASGGHGFIPFTFETDPTKTLTEIKIKDATTTSTALCIYVISAWGTKVTLAEVIAELNEKLNAINADTITKEECDALRLKIAELKASNPEITDEDFDTSKLEAAEERIAEEGRLENLTQNEMYYYPIEYNRDGFATYAEILEYGVFDSGYTFPEKDLAGNPLDTTAPWFGYKGLDKITPGTVATSKNIFLIDSIEGVEGGKVSAEAYTSATDYTKKTVTKTLQLNGIDNYELQSTEANGAKNYIYNADGFKYKFGPIGGTGDRLTATGGYNVRLLAEGEKYKFTRTQDGAKKLGTLFTLAKDNNEGTYAALEKVVVTYNDGRPAETKYLVMTAMNSDADIYANATSDGDRLSRVVVAVPKKDSAGVELDHTSGSVLKANAKILSEKTAEEIAGKKLTIEDVTFPSDFVVGKSMPIADYVLARNFAVYNDRRYCPQGYANHFEFDFGEEVTSIEYQGDIGYAKAYPGAVLNSQVAYIPVTIEGASEDYLYYARFGRPCGYTVALLAASSMGGALADRVDEVNAQLADAETKEDIIAALDAMNALIDAGEGAILAKDFETAAALAKLTAHIKADIAGVKSFAELEALEAEIEEYLTTFGVDVAELETAIAEKRVALERIEELKTGDKYTLGTIDWNYADNAQYLINAFEMSSVASIESTTDYYASISGQKYINTKSSILHDTIAEVLEKENTEKYTKTRGMSYYPTDKIQAATGTFPAADGNYYITTPKGVKFRIDGVTNTVGENGVTAGYVTFNDEDKDDNGSIYKVDFDGETKYNSVNLLVAGIGEPVWNGSPRQTIAAQANVYYADGSVEKQLVLIPSVWGYVPTLAGKLKTEDQLTGINVKHNYVNATPAVLGLSSNAEKFSWTPSNIDAEVFSVGSYMTTAFTNTAEERHAFKEMTNKAGAMASVKVDTKGKAVDYIEITHTEDEVLEAAGAFNAATNSDTHVYWLPISNEDVIELVGEDKTGVLNGKDAKVSECDFYIKIQRNCKDSGRGAMGILMAATGEKKYANLYAYIEEAEKAMSAITEKSSIEEAVAAKEIYDLAKSQTGITEADFNAKTVADFNTAYEAIRQKAEVEASLEVQYLENTATTVKVNITNLAELAGKPYAVLLTYLDENGIVAGTESFTGTSTAAKNETVTFTATKPAPEKAVKAKAYIWKALGSLKPLGNAVEVNKASYAVDKFFDAATKTFKADATGDLNLLFLGDSLTEGSSTYEIDGENADRPDHWTNVIAMYMKENLPSMNINVLNGGIGGTTTSFQTPILDGYALKCEPDIVFIENVNNYNTDSTKEDVESVEAIVRNLLKLEKVPTIIYYHAYSPYTPDDTYPVKVQTNRTNETQQKHRDDIDALLEKYNIASLDYISYFLDYTDGCKAENMTELYNEGNVHPKTAGYKLMGTYATGEFALAPENFFKRNVLKAEADSEKADDAYKVTYPNDSRFTYKNFTIYDNADDAAAKDINKRQYAFPFKGNVAQTRVGGAEIEFKTSAKEFSIYYVNPTIKYRTNTVKVYVDGEFKTNGARANEWASNYDYIKVSGLDGNEHTIKLVTDEPIEHSSGSILDIFNFMFLAEKE